MAKVSVIIPCYNQEEYLKDALNSLCGEFKDFEVIVVNDGSTNENAFEKIESICSEFNDLDIKLINQENQGVCIARNNAIKKASGKFIMPLDADDMISNEYLQKGSEILDKNNDIGIVYCEAEFFGIKSGKFNLAKPTIINMLSQNRIFNSAMYRKSDWQLVGGYNPRMQEGCEDWDFWLSLIEKNCKIYKIKEVLFKYRQFDISREKSALNFKNYFNIRKKIIKNHKKLYLKYNLIVLIPLFARILKEFICRR